MEEAHFLAKVLLIGNSGVGKSSLVERYTQNKFSLNISPTLVLNIVYNTVFFNDKSVKFQLWDTSGNDRYFYLTRIFSKGSSIILLIFDITNEKSFSRLNNWLSQNLNSFVISPLLVLVGTKKDLNFTRKVSSNKISKFCNKYHCSYFELSSLENDGISELFKYLANEVVNCRIPYAELENTYIPSSKPSRRCCGWL